VLILESALGHLNLRWESSAADLGIDCYEDILATYIDSNGSLSCSCQGVEVLFSELHSPDLSETAIAF